jgi:dipeptidyl aminopeptidase/acylaminoacyl peptidase
MTQKTIRPFGMWPSPITPASLAQSLRLSDVAWDSDGETLVWLEGRSDRGVLACASPGQAFRDLTSTLSVRARVGYGGGDMAVAGGHVYFVAQPGSSQAGRLYRQPLAAGEARPITPPFGHMASPAPSPDGRWVVYVYTLEGEDGLAVVDAEGKGWPGKLVTGQDFYMQPCWHPDGRHLAWVSWDHPNMPWDSTMLKMATLDVDGRGLPVVAETSTLVDRSDVAVFQPQFSPDGRSLAYVSDEGGWGNLWLYDLETGEGYPLTADPVDVIRPAWVQGIRTYGFSPNGRCIFYVRNEAGSDRLWVCDLDAREARAVQSPLNDYASLAQIAVAPSNGTAAAGKSAGGSLAFVASSSTVGARVVAWSPMCPAPSGAREVQIYRRATGETLSIGDLSTPQPVQWAAGDGMTVHGLYYPPASSLYAGTGLPPAIIAIHGGPTGQSTASYGARAQFFTSRGYAYLEVNYRGSTGYGKPYMAALRGRWGVLDVEDAIGGAQFLVDAGLADRDRLVVMGGSAGGYTVLKCLVDHPGFFRAALCLYGVSNMFTLAADTHKFEERYLDSMLGPLPEAGAVYRERSPIFNADRIVDPIAVFQGEIDRVVPKAQAETIVESLRRRGVPHEYHLYEGEGHGWRKQETIEAFYTTVERFLRQYVIFA